MLLFFFTFFTLYGLIHLYAFLKARAALSFGLLTGVLLGIFMATMVVAPIIIRQAEKAGLDAFARIFSFVGYTWMGVLFLFICCSLLLDTHRSALWLAGLATKKDLVGYTVPAPAAFAISITLAIVIAIYGYFEAQSVRVERVMLQSRKIPSGIGTVRVVQISDVHLGLIVRQGRLKRILETVKQEKPDILVSTGDLVDGQINGLSGLAELLQEIKPRYGKFAITGNHEFYAGLDQALAFTERAGFSILRGEGTAVAGFFNIAGVDDPAGRSYGLYRHVPEQEILSQLDRNRFTILLKHRPVVDKASRALFDLQLSGHGHGGQIFPFRIATWLYYPVHAGGSLLSDGSFLYVSRGAGTWGPPIRFLAPPEVTVIELAPQQSSYRDFFGGRPADS